MIPGLKIRTLLALAAGAVLIWMSVGVLNAQEMYREFSGTVTGADGQPAADGTEVTAVVNGQEAATGYVSSGSYAMMIPYGNSDANTQVVFMVNGREAGRYTLQAPADNGVAPPNTAANLDITAPATPVPPTQGPTPTPSPTNTPAPRSETLRGQVEGFEVPPEVALRPVVDEIDSDSDGIIEAWMYNSGLNKVNLVVEINLGVPSGIHISSTDGSFTSGAGRGVAKYIVEPGQGRTITFTVQADKIGKFTVSSSSKYWPEGQEPLWNPISLSHPFTVTQATGRSNAESVGNGNSAPASSGGCSIGAQVGSADISMIALGGVMLMGMGMVLACRKREDGG